jgi:hypothetical protein
VRQPVVDRRVEPELLGYQPAFLLSAGDPYDLAAALDS